MKMILQYSATILLCLSIGVSGFASRDLHRLHPAFGSTTELYAERKPLITGNWKLNPKTKQEAIELAKGVASSVTSYTTADVAIFVPVPFLEAVQNVVDNKFIVGAEVC